MPSRDLLLIGFGLLASGLVLIFCAAFARARTASDPVLTHAPEQRSRGWRTRPLRGRRAMARDLPDPALWTTVDAALSCLPVDESTRAAAVLVDRGTVSVRLLGRPPSAPPQPWYEQSEGWSASRDQVLDEAAGDLRAVGASDTFIAIGRAGQCTALLDLARIPGTLAVGGEPRAAMAFFEALLSQVESVGCHRLLVAAGTVQDTPEAGVAELVRGLPSGLAASARPNGTHLTFLACATPTEDEAVLLRRALIDCPWLRVLILGQYQGTHMPLIVDRRGRVDSPTLDLIFDGSVLPQIAPQRPRVPHRPTPERVPVARRPPDDFALPNDLPLTSRSLPVMATANESHAPARTAKPLPVGDSGPVVPPRLPSPEIKPDPASDTAPASEPEPRPTVVALPSALAPLPSRDPALSADPLARRPRPIGVSPGPQDVAREPQH